MKKHRNKIIAGIVIAAVLALVFWYGGDAPGLRGWAPADNKAVAEIPIKTETETAEEVPETTKGHEEADQAQKAVSITAEKEKEEINHTDEEKATEKPTEQEVAEKSDADVKPKQTAQEVVAEKQGMVIDEATGKDKYLTDPVPEGKPVPVEPQDAVISDKELTCTLLVRCDTILDNIEWLDKEKVALVPDDGVIFPETTVTFYEGESVFNLLLREMKRNKIHMEFENTPIYNSAYIEGINNLYEFDCGELSGWMYSVNGWFPNYGCSRYQLKAGDKVEFVYTCDLGIDVGGQYAAKGK